MRYVYPFLYLTLLIVVTAQIGQAQDWCPVPSTGSGVTENPAYGIQTDTTIPVVFHVITGTGGVGNVTDAQIADQIDVLNAAFVPPDDGSGGSVSARFYFELLGISRIERQDWHAYSGPGTGFSLGLANCDLFPTQCSAEGEAKQALTVDPAHVLNVYVVDLPESQLGYAYFPFPNIHNPIPPPGTGRRIASGTGSSSTSRSSPEEVTRPSRTATYASTRPATT